MQAIAGGAAARPFVTHHNTLDLDLFLRIAPELYLKRLLVGGMERVFEIGRVYRNEGISPKHNPEFTMLEAYQAYGDYHSMMDLTEALIVGAIEALDGDYQRPWGEHDGRLHPPLAAPDLRRPVPRARRGRPDATPTPSAPRPSRWGSRRPARTPTSIVSEVFEETVEDALTGPVFVIDYPAAICPLTKRKASRPGGRRAVRAVRPRDGAGQRLHRAERPDLQEALFREPARRPEGRGLDGQDGRRLRPRPEARHAPGRRPGRRHRPALHAPAEQGEHPRRDPVPAAAAGT